MAQLTIPADFERQLTLLQNIIAEDETLGTNSPVSAFLQQQKIVLADDATAGETARTHEAARSLLKKQSENYRQLRDNFFAKPWQNLTGSVQFLKKFYTGNTKELGNWGVTITESGKVNHPAAFDDRIKIFGDFVQKHQSFEAGTSPLHPYLMQHNINLEADTGFTVQAAGNHKRFLDASRSSEDHTSLRDELWDPVMKHLSSIGGFLMKLYSNNPKALGAWGFIVSDSTKKPRLRTTRLKLGEKITTNGIVLGSTLTNVGETDIHVYKGKTTTGTPFIIHRGEQFGIQKGFSSVTVVNVSAIQEAKFRVYVVN